MRGVKLGTNAMSGTPLAYHWAVKVGDTWYEKAARKGRTNSVKISHGFAAASSTGAPGGELVGETDATDDEIDDWLEEWLHRNADFGHLSANCQKFAYEFMDWLTDGNFSVPHRFNASTLQVDNEEGVKYNSFARIEDGNAIIRHSSTEFRDSAGPVSISGRLGHAQTQLVIGPGLGAWVDASLYKFEASYWNVAGVHVEPNLNTGVGIRNGNLDVHLLGFGVKIDADCIEVDTPLGGVNACSIM